MDNKLESFLAHYGVRGMKWGIRDGKDASLGKLGAKNVDRHNRNVAKRRAKGKPIRSEQVGRGIRRVVDRVRGADPQKVAAIVGATASISVASLATVHAHKVRAGEAAINRRITEQRRMDQDHRDAILERSNRQRDEALNRMAQVRLDQRADNYMNERRQMFRDHPELGPFY